MPESLEHGPLQDRRCTDILFYIVYVLFIGAMLGAAGYGFANGDPAKLFAPLDSDGNNFHISRFKLGNICGYDPGYTDYPYMYVWDIEFAVKSLDNIFDSSVCVK
jgi:hypothetical protein